jgi:hypothetical protein
MTARFNERFSADAGLMAGQVAACRGVLLGNGSAGEVGAASGGVGEVAAVAFPALAARLGVGPVPWERAARILGAGEEEEGGMGMNLVKGQGRFAGSGVTREEYEAYTSGLKVTAGITEAEAREACLEFFKHYAFQVYGAGTGTGGGGGGGGGGGSSTLAVATRDACVYLLASLINHCCTPPCFPLSSKSRSKAGPNCSWRIGPSGLAQFIKPRHICVQARRAIREGEQLTWDYGKREKGFVCQCDTCRDSLMGGLGSLWRSVKGGGQPSA